MLHGKQCSKYIITRLIIAFHSSKFSVMKNQTELILAAQNVRKKAYAPYSNFHVGASVSGKNGKIYSGCNVENASYGLTICAERNALASAIADGESKFESLAVTSPNGVSPCGACRQVIWELCGDIPIILVDDEGNTSETSSSLLLPHQFDKSSLNI
mgnify:CR=1 FL=1|jgi:cytidine deaminase